MGLTTKKSTCFTCPSVHTTARRRIGEGLVLRYDETSRQVVGPTLIGLRARLLQGLAEAN